MTRKDYIVLAAALSNVRASYAPHWDPNLFRACDDHVKMIADTLQRDNPRFARDRFYKAAGYGLREAA